MMILLSSIHVKLILKFLQRLFLTIPDFPDAQDFIQYTTIKRMNALWLIVNPQHEALPSLHLM